MTTSPTAPMHITAEEIKSVRIRAGKSQEAFGAEMGITRETVNKMETGKAKISAKNRLWYLEHYREALEELKHPAKPEKTDSFSHEKKHDYKSGVPVFEAHLSAAFINTMNDELLHNPAFYMKGNRFADCTFGALAKGDHAMTCIRSGDLLLCREVTDYQFIDYSCIYFIAGKNGLEMCRYIHPHPADNKILLLKSDLPDVPPSPLPKQYITHLFKVRGIIRSF